MEWEELDGHIDIAKHWYEDSEWLVYADEKLGGGEHCPYEETCPDLRTAKKRARKIYNSEHPENPSVILGYVEITEIEA
jgi:hypothetical protein